MIDQTCLTEAPSSSNVAPPIQVGHQDSNNNTAVLWVEKFRPKNFIELLSDDGTNRTLLRWLKLWDKAVFNREPKAKPPKPEDLNKGDGKDGKFQPGGGGGGKFQKFNANNEVIEELDKDGRPVQKVTNIAYRLSSCLQSITFFLFVRRWRFCMVPQVWVKPLSVTSWLPRLVTSLLR